MEFTPGKRPPQKDKRDGWKLPPGITEQGALVVSKGKRFAVISTQIDPFAADQDTGVRAQTIEEIEERLDALGISLKGDSLRRKRKIS